MRSSLKLSFLISTLLAPQPALAGAWLAPEGHGQVVVTGTASTATNTFDGGGSLQSTPRYNKYELQALIEYGVTDWFTAMAIPALQHVSIAPPTNASRTGFGNSEFGGRVRLIQQDNWILSGQATVRVPGTGDTNNPAAIGYTGTDVDLRALFGVSFPFYGMPAFFDAQLAQRFRTGGPPHEIRLDLSFGLRTAQQWLVLVQQFNVISEGAGEPPFAANNYHKLQFSLIYDLTPQWSLQGGAFTTFAGRNALQENGALAAVWYRF